MLPEEKNSSQNLCAHTTTFELQQFELGDSNPGNSWEPVNETNEMNDTKMKHRTGTSVQHLLEDAGG